MEGGHQRVEGHEAGTDVVPDGGVGQPPVSGPPGCVPSAAPRDGPETPRSSLVKISFVTTPSLALVAEPPAERQQQRGLAAADRSADSDRKRAGSGRVGAMRADR